MSTDTLTSGLEELRTRMGLRERRLRGSVEVNQVYAHYQHEHPEFHHPRGGMAFYLTTPLMMHYREYLADIGRGMLDDGGQAAMKRSMEHLSDEVEITAPREFHDLRRSGHPVVQLGERVIYDRPPKVGRLSEEDLRIKSRIRYMALPDRLKGWIWWHVQHHVKPPPRRGRR